MTLTAPIVAVPSTGAAVSLFASNPSGSASQVSIRNTGTVTVLLGPSGAINFPLAANEFIGLNASADLASLQSVVQSNGTAGQLTLLVLE